MKCYNDLMHDISIVYPRLVAGTFLSILNEYRVKNASSYKDFVIAFIKALGVDIGANKKSLSGAQITNLTRCDSRPFHTTIITDTFLKTQKLKLSTLSTSVSTFFGSYMQEGAQIIVTAALKEMIESDSAIDEKEEFLLHEDVGSITKEDVRKTTEFPCIPFITGVAIYAFGQDNTQGKGTINAWSDSKERGAISTDIGKKYWGVVKDTRISSEGKDSHVSVKRRKLEDSDYAVTLSDLNALSRLANEDPDLYCLLDSASKYYELFVETDIYRETYKKVLNSSCVMLTGNPGTGKTTTSEMIALKMVGIGEYRIRYLKNKNSKIEELYNQVKANPDVKEFVLIDDCLGQSYFDLSSDDENCLHRFVAYVGHNINKKLLLNSRIKVMEDSKTHKLYESVFQEMNDKGRVVRFDEYKRFEKAKILRRHIFVRTDEEHYRDISKNSRCIKIVEHQSFNPRIIDYITRKTTLAKIRNDGDYYKQIIDSLNNPKDIWKYVYTNDTPTCSKTLLKALFSLTSSVVETEKCKKVFEKFLSLDNFKGSYSEEWDKALAGVNESMVKMYASSPNDCFISFIDHSLYDYLNNSIYPRNSTDRKLLDKGIVYELQVKALYGYGEQSNYKGELTKNGRILNLLYYDEGSKALDVFECVARTRIRLEEYRPLINTALSIIEQCRYPMHFYRSRYNTSCETRMLLSMLEDSDFSEFYFGSKLSKRVFLVLTKNVDIKEAIVVLKKIEGHPEWLDFDFDDDMETALMESSCDNSLSNCNDFIDYVSDYGDWGTDEVNDRLNDYIYEHYNEILDDEECNLPSETWKKYKAIFAEKGGIDFTEDIKEYFYTEENDDEEDNDDEEKDNGDWSLKEVAEYFKAPFGSED